MNNYANVAQDEVFHILTIDAGKYSDVQSRFIRDNQTTYDVALNTWLRIVDDNCGCRAVRALKGALLSYGLKDVVGECCEFANAIIADLPTTHGAGFCRELIASDKQKTLQNLRYLKRFTPCNPKKLYEASIVKFLELNDHHRTPPRRISIDGRVLERNPIGPRWLLDRVKVYCHEIIGEFSYDPDNWVFSGGVTAEGSKTVLAKLRDYAAARPHLFCPLYPIGISNTKPACSSVRVIAVPKSYKAARVIAAAPTLCGTEQQAILAGLLRAVARTRYGSLIHIDDQDVNKELCRLGSVYNVYATVDLSGASDSISESLAAYVLPSEVYQAICTCNPDYMEVNGKRIKRFIFQTSGNATTFICETIIFLAIVLCANEYASLYLQQSIMTPVVYGDDMICDCGTYETLLDFLDMLGFTVNVDKSYGSESDYRESCGVEFENGISLTTSYYPRKPIGNDDGVSVESLCSLQHKLFGYVSAETWLTGYIRQRMQRVIRKPFTSSDVGSNCSDLWDYYPMAYQITAPYDHDRMDSCQYRRELHYSLQAKYKSTAIADDDRALLDMYYYTMFLRDGGQLIEYGDTFSAHLAAIHHWTQSAVMYARDSGLPEHVWQPTKR